MNKLILISNDDGIESVGIKTLETALESLGRVVVVAPDKEQSAASHSLTLRKPIEVNAIDDNHYGICGTPTDCVLLATQVILDRAPDLIVSGINHGPNMGEDVTYSGTVAAAFEAHILGMPSLAASMKDSEHGDYEGAAQVIVRLTARAAEWASGGRLILNVNFPKGPASTWKPVPSW